MIFKIQPWRSGVVSKCQRFEEGGSNTARGNIIFLFLRSGKTKGELNSAIQYATSPKIGRTVRNGVSEK